MAEKKFCLQKWEDKKRRQEERKRKCTESHRGPYVDASAELNQHFTEINPNQCETHSFCTIRKDKKRTGCLDIPPKGLPWASGKLKYLPGHATLYQELTNLESGCKCEGSKKISDKRAKSKERKDIASSCLDETEDCPPVPQMVVCQEALMYFCKGLSLAMKLNDETNNETSKGEKIESQNEINLKGNLSEENQEELYEKGKQKENEDTQENIILQTAQSEVEEPSKQSFVHSNRLEVENGNHKSTSPVHESKKGSEDYENLTVEKAVADESGVDSAVVLSTTSSPYYQSKEGSSKDSKIESSDKEGKTESLIKESKDEGSAKESNTGSETKHSNTSSHQEHVR